MEDKYIPGVCNIGPTEIKKWKQAVSAIGFLQAYMHFCAYFGFASLFNFGDVGKTYTVQQAEFRSKDRSKAWQIVIYSNLSTQWTLLK